MSIVRKRFLRTLPKRDCDFIDEVITPDMVGRRVSECRRLRPVGRGRPYGLLGYTIDGHAMKVAYSLAHHNDIFDKKVAHKTVDARINSDHTFDIDLEVKLEKALEYAKYALPDPMIPLFERVFKYESQKYQATKVRTVVRTSPETTRSNLLNRLLRRS